MKACIEGIYIESQFKDRIIDGKTVNVPYVVLYSGDETVKIENVSIDEKTKVGDIVRVVCDIHMSEWNGRKYLSIKPIRA